jgi:REP element-mobilizing transposase RayT
MQMNSFGDIVAAHWRALHTHHHYVRIDTFVVMPNHIHGILVLSDGHEGDGEEGDRSRTGVHHRVGLGHRAGRRPAPKDGVPSGQGNSRHGLSELIRGFKSFSAREINLLRGTPGVPVWQRNFYEHVIRDKNSLEGIRKYILENPLYWETDPENPVIFQQTVEPERGNV